MAATLKIPGLKGGLIGALALGALVVRSEETPPASVPAPARVVVVDNASSDGSADEAERAGAVVLRRTTNAGFGPA